MSAESAFRVTGLDHVYLAVRDFERSVAFYDRVMRLLGFKKGTFPIGGEPHAHYFIPETQITIRPARTDAPHDSYRAGLHHLCLRVDDRRAVDEIARGLEAIGVQASEPRLYPEYASDYYATFFEDPDALRFEVVALRRGPVLLRDHWHELDDFEDPLRKKGLA